MRLPDPADLRHLRGSSSGADDERRLIRGQMRIGVWTLRILVMFSVLLGVGSAVLLVSDRSYHNLWQFAWIAQIPFVLIPGLLASVFWSTRQKWRLFGLLVLTFVASFALMFPTSHIVEDRGVRSDIPALEDAWAKYQAGTLGSDDEAGLHWYNVVDGTDPVMAIIWGGFIDYDYGSVFVPDGSRGLCEQFSGWCRCREVEPAFYFCQTDP